MSRCYLILMHLLHLFFFQKKPCAVFEIAEVVPVMTNNYEDSILKGVKVINVLELENSGL